MKHMGAVAVGLGEGGGTQGTKRSEEKEEKGGRGGREVE